MDDAGQVRLPNNGELTFHDGLAGSSISGNTEAWNKMNLYLVDHIKTNVFDSLKDLNENVIHYENNHLSLNIFGPHDRRTCIKAATKKIIRFHPMDLKRFNVRPMKQSVKEMMIEKWLKFYDFFCWEKKLTALQLGVPFTG